MQDLLLYLNATSSHICSNHCYSAYRSSNAHGTIKAHNQSLMSKGNNETSVVSYVIVINMNDTTSTIL
ncbi:MAG TPA: hypothetical protein VD794_11345 [Flavisolibacter sp.]|nr:hypothetical protein [Flavisolibacter sp.]